jgi:hypothetical protein
MMPSSDPKFPTPTRVPRDLTYERLIALAKEARERDVQIDSTSDRTWRYAATICKLNQHPMSWLLRWSGIREQKPWWDGLLLISSAILLTVCFIAVMVLGIVETWTRLGWIVAALGLFIASLLLHFGSRRIEEWQLRRAVDKYRAEAGLPRRLL